MKLEANEKHEKQRVRAHKPSTAVLNAKSTVKLTTASILREEAFLRKKKKEQLEAMAQSEMGLRDIEEFEHWKEQARQREEEEIQLSLEKKRLEIQLLHEDTFLAKQEILKLNKERVAEMNAEKQEMKHLGAELKREVEEHNKKKIEEVHQIQELAAKAKERVAKEKLKQGIFGLTSC